MIKFFFGYAISYLKSLSRETLILIIFFVPFLSTVYMRYNGLSQSMSDVNKSLFVIQDQIKEHQKDHVLVSSMQNRTNNDLKQYIDGSMESLKKEIIQDVGSQLKYQLIYQNSVSRKAIIDQLELWMKSYNKNKNNENTSSYQTPVDTSLNGF